MEYLKYERGDLKLLAERGIRQALLGAACAVVLLSLSALAHSHEGELDSFGCHYDKERKHYHCHHGEFAGGSFDSKTQMIQQLRSQYLNLGRPWPYGDLIEEDITSPQPESPPPNGASPEVSAPTAPSKAPGQ